MTAKEKAIELFNNFFPYVEAMSSRQQDENAKQCALIAVQISIKELDAYNKHGGLQWTIDFWQEVKQEIEKL